jgi:hypothetical protein
MGGKISAGMHAATDAAAADTHSEPPGKEPQGDEHYDASKAASTDTLNRGAEHASQSFEDTDSELLFTSKSEFMPDALLVEEEATDNEAEGVSSQYSDSSRGLLDDAINGLWDGAASAVVEYAAVFNASPTTVLIFS